MDPSPAIGIDLGTTFCCVAVLLRPDKQPQIIPNDIGRNTTPSYVAYAYDEEEDAVEVVVGEAAKDAGMDSPESAVFDIKRIIGRSYYDSHVQRYMQLWPFCLVNIHGLVGVKVEEKTLLPQLIAKELISYLIKTAENYLHCKITSAVVTVPAYFNDLQRGLTKEACTSAGLKSVHFITEPTAAAYTYGIQPSLKWGATKTVLIFDLGGGTFDLTVFTLDSGKKVKIKAIGGDSRLGGEDFNDLLVQYCISEFKRIHKINLAEGKTSDNPTIRSRTAKKLRRIRKECEKQKCYLSSAKAVVISMDCIHGEIGLEVRVTLAIFEKLIQGHLNRCINTMEKFLNRNQIEKKGIDHVVLIGGSTRIPKVQQVVSDFFDGIKLHRHLDADEAVACGAAVHAYNIFQPGSESNPIITLIDTIEDPDGYDSMECSPLKEEEAEQKYLLKDVSWMREAISGLDSSTNEAQILAACLHKLNQAEDIKFSLDDLNNLFEEGEGSQVDTALNLVLTVLDRYETDRAIQYSAVRCLRSIVRFDGNLTLEVLMKQTIISSLVRTINLFKSDVEIFAVCFLTLCLFQLPQDLYFMYTKFVSVIVDTLGLTCTHDETKIALRLILIATHGAEGSQKKLAGELEVVSRVLRIVELLLKEKSHGDDDYSIEVSWTILYSLTDEQPKNCELFMAANGLDLFLQSWDFQTDNYLKLRLQMLGALGNVSEVNKLRPQLMNSDLISRLNKCLESTEEDEDEDFACWLKYYPMERKPGKLQMFLGIMCWTMYGFTLLIISLSFKYKYLIFISLLPVLRLLTIEHTPVCQLWAAWELANQVRLRPAKYVPMLKKEKGFDIIRSVKSTDTEINSCIEEVLEVSRTFQATLFI